MNRGGVLVLVGSSLSLELSQASSDSATTDTDDLIAHWMDSLQVRPILSEVMPIADYTSQATVQRLPVDGHRMPSPLGRIGIVNTYERQGFTGTLVYRMARTDDSGEDDPTVIRDAHGIVLARKHVGNGWVYIISDPYIFSNMLIQEVDNAQLATGIAMSSTSGDKARIVFDEYHLGFVQTRSLGDAARTPVGKAILYLGVIAALAIASAGARLGRPRKGQVPVGVSQRAFVEALAGLWQGANATTSVADALWRRYRGKSAVRKKGLDVELDKMRKSTARLDDLMEISKKLES